LVVGIEGTDQGSYGNAGFCPIWVGPAFFMVVDSAPFGSKKGVSMTKRNENRFILSFLCPVT